MKKLNIICYVIGIVCFLIAGYIVYDEFIEKNDEIVINTEEELNNINSKLSDVGSPLGWLIIVDGINNQDSDGNYNVTYGKDLLYVYENRQLFVMEYILSYESNYDKFIVLDQNGKELDGIPVDDFTLAYLDYDTFNDYYKVLFGDDFDLNNSLKGNTSYDDEYVYYDNRRAGANGVYVSMITADDIEYIDEQYVASVTVTYSTRASELVNCKEDYGTISYTKDINGNINLKSFILKDR